jgi:pyridinium-3,5-bisthiocarboxylic acid mononucleotide nickel chelatase
MAKIAYFDCPTGIAGNMCLGALIDGGVPLDYLREMLAQLPLKDEYELIAETVHHQGQRALHVEVTLQPHSSPHRHLPDIEGFIQQASLPPRVKTWSLDIFRTLAIAEGTVHGIPPESVHFHEVGATDAIVDIVGTCIGLDWLGIDQVFCSALPTGGGTVRAAHGLLPVPVPAVLNLLSTRQVPVYDNGIQKELVTPTGAAIAVTLAQSFGAAPPMQLQRIGLGAGTQSFEIPNLLRLWIGETKDNASSLETIVVLETQLDDINPQIVGYLYDELFAAGAVDVFTQPIGMKKSRPGILLTVLLKPEQVETCEAILFRETTTLGIRRSVQQRTVLPRQIKAVETPLGKVRVKVAYSGDRIVNVQPEYEDCVQLARQHAKPLHEIQQLALWQWQSQSQ